MEERKVKMAVGAKEKPEMSQYLPDNTKAGNFNPQRTLSRSFFIIPERFESIHAIVLAFTIQTNKHSNTYIDRLSERRASSIYIFTLMYVHIFTLN